MKSWDLKKKHNLVGNDQPVQPPRQQEAEVREAAKGHLTKWDKHSREFSQLGLLGF